MQSAVPHPRVDDAPRRPGILGLSAAGLLAASVVLHLLALIPHYYQGTGQGSLWSESDQAAQYTLLAAGWALALGLALAGPARARVGAALAVGLAATEFGFRLSDLGEVFRYGPGSAGAGLWLMTAAWVVGAAGAVLAVLAVRRRPREASPEPAPLGSTGVPVRSAETTGRSAPSAVDPTAPRDTGSDVTAPLGVAAPDVTEPLLVPRPGSPDTTEPLLLPRPWSPDTTEPLLLSRPGSPDATERLTPTLSVSAPPDDAAATGSLGAGPTALAALLALATAGAFLPAWDHYAGVATTTGRAVTFNLGNAFSGPWQIVLGTVCVAVALLAVPVLATRMRHRAAGAAMVAGALIVLGTQFTAAVIQVGDAVPPSVAGLSPAQARQLGLQLHMTLTGWFTFDLLAAFALFVAAMVAGHVREAGHHETALGPWAQSPYPRGAVTLPPS